MATILERNKNTKPKKKTVEEYAEDALYREVWEEVNNEKTQRFIKKYARQMMAAAIGLLIIVVGVQIGLNSYRASRLAAAQNYETAVANGDAAALEAMGRQGRGAMADLALFQSYLLSGKRDALEYLANQGHSRDFRDLARIHVVGLRGDEMTVDEVVSYLAPLDTEKSPYYYTSRLLVAQKYLSAGNRDAAMPILEALVADKNTPAMVAATAATLR